MAGRDVVGRDLANLRQATGLRQKDVAAVMGVSQARVHEIEHSRRPTKEVISRYLRAIGWSSEPTAEQVNQAASDFERVRRCSECGTEVVGSQRRLVCSRKCRDRRTRRLNPASVAAKERRWRLRNLDRVALYQRLRVLRKQGVTEDWYRDQMVGQAGRCAICCQVFPSDRLTHIDHDHATGRPRGLLCHHCNTAIGLLRESPQLMAAAARYLGGA